MPAALRELYQAGEWKNYSVYLWPTVLSLSQAGHSQHAAAEAALAPMSYTPNGAVADGESLASAAVADADAVGSRIGPRVRKVLAARRAERTARLREQSRVYMQKRRLWVSQLDAMEEQRTDAEKDGARQRDRELLMATRASSGMGGGMTNREIDLIFCEIEAAGGTAGGLERWGRSITGIPDHNPDYLPPASDGGGVRVENPLADHYAARNVNPWTKSETMIFLEKFVVHGKNFRKVATFFEHKSVEDCVRFYFDNKMRLGLKQLAKEAQVRKRGTKKLALSELSKLPTESRSIKDNFIHQPGFFSAEEQEEDKESMKAEKLSSGAIGKGWTPRDRRALIFALCRFDVTGDEEGKPVTNVWASIAAIVGSKTPRQCRQFYFQFKTILGLGGYSPPKPTGPPASKRAISPANAATADSGPRKVLRRSNSVVRNNSSPVPAAVGECYANGGGTTNRIS